MQVHNPSTSTLKCPTCRQTFSQQSLHKAHYKSDFHRYNLKRSMVNLPPATFQQFSTKRTQVRADQASSFQCGQCRKTFSSKQTLQLHGVSKRHNLSMALVQKPKVQPKVIVYVKNAKRCLFCLKQYTTVEDVLRHMTTIHSFFIAQQNYCINKKQLLEYLQEKIQVGNLCINCDNKGAKDFSTGQSVRKHMLSKNHTFMNTQAGFQEYQSFYDFSQLFKEKLEEQKFFSAPTGINFQKVKVLADDQKAAADHLKKNGKSKQPKQSNDDEQWSDQQDGGQWEDDSDEQEDKNDNQIAEQDENQQIKQKIKRKVKAYNIMVPTITNTDQLLLPNGKTLGHRKYRRFYKQTFKLNNWFDNNKMKMLDNSSAQQALVLRQHVMQAMSKQARMKGIKIRQLKHSLKTGMNNNTTMQKFFKASCTL